MNSMFQVESEEQTISAPSSATDMGWAKLLWYYAHGIFTAVCLGVGIIGPLFLLLIYLSKASRDWVRSDKNRKKMNRYYLISSIIFLLLTSLIMFAIL